MSTFFVDSWEAECPDGKYYLTCQQQNGEPCGFQTVLKITDKDMNALNEKFLAAEIFEGKSFWQMEKDLIWVDEEHRW